MSELVKTKLTAEEFWALYSEKEEFADGKRLHYELINGEVVDTFLHSIVHGEVQARLARHLSAYQEIHNEYTALLEIHCIFGAATLCVCDAALVSGKRLLNVAPWSYLPFAPELAVEILEPTDTAQALQDRIETYLHGGTQAVWTLHPSQHKIVVYHANKRLDVFRQGEMIIGGDLFPNLAIPVEALFPPDEPKTESNS